ncbi:MAG: hypothetical protein ACK53V_10640, partial [Planctomycetota bacterium]
MLFISNVFLRPELAERDWEQPVTEVTNAEILGKMLYFSQELAPQFQQQGNLEDMLGQLDSGPLEQRYCQALALNEFDGPEAGLHQLERIDELVEREGYQPNERQQKLRGVVQKLLEARLENGALAEDALTAEEKEYLTKQLRWFGRLALNPEELPGAGRAEVRNQAAKGTVVLFSAMGVGLAFVLAGCFGLLVFLMMLVLGRLQSW